MNFLPIENICSTRIYLLNGCNGEWMTTEAAPATLFKFAECPMLKGGTKAKTGGPSEKTSLNNSFTRSITAKITKVSNAKFDVTSRRFFGASSDTFLGRKHGILWRSQQPSYFIVGIVKSAPARMPVGQRVVIVLRRV